MFKTVWAVITFLPRLVAVLHALEQALPKVQEALNKIEEAAGVDFIPNPEPEDVPEPS